MTKAVENKERVIVGVNEFMEREELPIEIFRPPKDTEEKQKRKLRKLREKRDNRKVRNALSAVEMAAKLVALLSVRTTQLEPMYAAVSVAAASMRAS